MNSVDISERIEKGEAANNKEVHVDSLNLDTSNKLLVVFEVGLEASASHVDFLSSMTAEPCQASKPDSQGGVSSREGKEG